MKLKIYGVLLLFALSLSSCEKDDICDPATSTTPRLIIQFYDIANPTIPKNVVNLSIQAVDQSIPLATFDGVSIVQLPLKALNTSTKYSLILNSLSTTYSNQDFLEFNYNVQNVYISRACGFKSIFTLNTNNGVILTDALLPDALWIKGIAIQTNSINDENTTHIKIYF